MGKDIFLGKGSSSQCRQLVTLWPIICQNLKCLEKLLLPVLFVSLSDPVKNEAEFRHFPLLSFSSRKGNHRVN
jgi:hypothetical protein